jgi:hypothetical protein
MAFCGERGREDVVDGVAGGDNGGAHRYSYTKAV